MIKASKVAGMALAITLLVSFSLVALGASPKPSQPFPNYRQMVENTTARDQYIAAAWSRFGQLEKERAQDVQVTVTLRHSLSPSAAEDLAIELGLRLVAWDAMVGDGTVHRYTAGRIADDVADVVQTLRSNVNPNLTASDVKVVALFGTFQPADARTAQAMASVLAIDPTGDKRVSGAQHSRFAPHLFWTLPDHRSR